MGAMIVFLGAGIGGACRHFANLAALRLLGPNAFPWGTLSVNVLGSSLMGMITGVFLARTGLPQIWRLFLTTGVLGGFTTFSAFSLDAALLYQRGQVGAAAGYVVGTVALSIAGLFAGLALARLLGHP